MDFHQIFRIFFPQEDLEANWFLGVSGNSCCHSNAINTLRFSLLFKRGGEGIN